MANSLDAVSDRDFVLETLSAASIAAVHMSRFAEEIVIWTSPLVGLVRLSDKFTTGSSIMPQKRNPDAAELVRAKTGRVIGALNGLLIVMKGLPLAYQKDMQEDKQGAMEAFAALSLAIRAMTGMVLDLVPDENRMKAAAGEGYATATDLADWLVRTLKMPFRDAHHVTGRIVGLASKQGVALHELPLKAMQEVEPKITAEPCGCCRWKLPSRAGPAMAAPRRRTCFAGQSLAEAAGKRAKIGLRKNFAAISWFSWFPLPIGTRQTTAIFVWCARIGDFVVISNYRPSSSGWAIILLSVTALALGGCGRKAGLDLPPTAAAPQAQARRIPSRARGAARRLQFDLRIRGGAQRAQGRQEEIRSRSAAGLEVLS
jgi:predicted small lipoprotein YifL